MRHRRNQKEILKRHTLRRRPLPQPRALHLPEHKRYCVPQLHAREVDADAGPRARAEGMERGFGVGGGGWRGNAFFGGYPAGRVEPGGRVLVELS